MARAFAFVLALVPFSPPSGWTVDPVIARQPVPFVWVRADSRPDAEQPRIWAELNPLPNPLPLADAAADATIQGVSSTESTTTLCGGAAKIVETRSQVDGVVDSDSVFERSHGYSYIVTYTRTRGANSDPGAEQFIRAFCPSSPDAVRALSVPSGWTLLPAMRVVQAWSDRSSQQHITLLRGDPMASLWFVTDTALTPFIGQPGATVKALPPLTLCGHEAREVSATLAIEDVTVLEADIIATQTNSGSYLLEYQMTAPSSTALAAMHAFCPSP